MLGLLKLKATERAVAYLQCIPEGKRERAGGLIHWVVPRDAGAVQDHVDQGLKTLPLVHML